MAVFDGVCELFFGCTFALQSQPEYLESAMLFDGSLIFFMLPLTRSPLLTHLRRLTLPPGLLGQCLLCPLLLPLASSPRGERR